MPEITRTEWERLAGALSALSTAEQAAVHARADELAQQVRLNGEQSSVICPLLDREQGTCLVYEGRPLGCRTYGFYRAHHHDAFCALVEAHAAGQDMLVFGNYDVAEHALSALDPERCSLLVWLAQHRASSHAARHSP